MQLILLFTNSVLSSCWWGLLVSISFCLPTFQSVISVWSFLISTLISHCVFLKVCPLVSLNSLNILNTSSLKFLSERLYRWHILVGSPNYHLHSLSVLVFCIASSLWPLCSHIFMCCVVRLIDYKKHAAVEWSGLAYVLLGVHWPKNGSSEWKRTLPPPFLGIVWLEDPSPCHIASLSLRVHCPGVKMTLPNQRGPLCWSVCQSVSWDFVLHKMHLGWLKDPSLIQVFLFSLRYTDLEGNGSFKSKGTPPPILNSQAPKRSMKY